MASIIQRWCVTSWKNRCLTSKMHYGTDRIHPGYKKLKMNQERFQKENGCPIHLKKGIADKALYYTTVALAGAGVAASFKYFYNLIYPHNNQSENESDEDN